MSIPLIGPDGREYELDNADPAALDEVLRQGFRQQLPKYEPQTTGEKVAQLGADAADIAGTGAFGVLQGVTGGLAGVALGAKHGNGPTSEREEAARFAQSQIEKHPEAYLAGDLAGAVVSPLGKLQGAITKGIGATTAVGRIASGVVGGGAVGALQGAGNTLSDAALGDHDLTAEKLFAGAGLGAIIGGGASGLGSVLEEGISAVVPRIGKAVAGSAPELADWANNRALKAAGATKSDLDYLGAEKAKEVGDMLLERGHLGRGLEAPNAAGVLKSVSAEKEQIGAQLGKVFEDAHAVGAQPEYAKVLQRLDDFEAGLSPLQRKAIASEVQTAREAVQEYAENGAGFKALNELKQDLQAKAKWSKANPAEAFSGQLKRQLSGVVREELDTQIMSHMTAFPGAGKEFQGLKKLYGLLADAERLAEHGAEKLGGNASFGLRDLGIGAAAGLGNGNPVTGVVAAIANKVMRERGQAVIARLADSIAKSPRLSVAAESFGGQLQLAAPQLGQYAGPLMQALERSPAQALATHMTMAKADPGYSEAAQLAGFLPETPEENAHAMYRAGGLAGVASILEHNNQEIERGVDRVLKGNGKAPPPKALHSQDFGSKRMRRDAEAAHQQRMTEIRQLAADPSALVDKVAANMGQLSDVAPGVAAAVTRKAHEAVAFLASEVQLPPKAGPLAPDWVPTNAERHTFTRLLETVQDPMSILRHAAAGTMTEDQVRALTTVYPMLGRQIADKALERITEGKKTVPYKSRLMLMMLTGVDVDGTLSPAAVARNQAAIHATDVGPGAPQSPGERKSELTLAQRTALPNQQREMPDGDT